MKRIILATLILFPLSSFAGTYLSPQKVVGIATGWSGSDLYIETNTQLTAENCPATDLRAVLEDSHPQFNLVSSILLSALHANSNVRLYINGCTQSGSMKLMGVGIVE